MVEDFQWIDFIYFFTNTANSGTEIFLKRSCRALADEWEEFLESYEAKREDEVSDGGMVLGPTPVSKLLDTVMLASLLLQSSQAPALIPL